RRTQPRRPPVYFVSSNTHAIANLVGGYAQSHMDEIIEWARRENPEGLVPEIERAEKTNDPTELAPLLYYLLRGYIHASEGTKKMNEVRGFEATHGLVHLSEPGHIHVDAQIAKLNELDPSLLDPRLKIDGLERLRKS